LSRFTLESDQGSGLSEFARLLSFTQRFCLCHFLVTLKDRVFAVFVPYLVKAKTEAEFLLLREDYRFQVHKSIDLVNRARTGDGLKRAENEFAELVLLLSIFQVKHFH
jgi:hypothetical protein